MSLLSAEDYLESIRRRPLRIFYRGELLENAVDPAPVWAAANCVAEVYRAALDPETAELMTTRSALVDGPINVSNMLWRSTEDLVRRIKWEREMGRRTGRGALRSPGLDAINALAIITAWADAEYGTEYTPRFRAFLQAVQEGDLAVSAAMTDPRGDRSKRAAEQRDPDLYLRVVARDARGVTLRGAKMHQTSAVHCHEHLVVPMPCAAGEKDYAIACAVPSDAKGITHIYSRQPGDSRRAENLPMDVGMPDFGGCESTMIFDDVFVPWERVFLDGETALTSDLVSFFGAFHRFCYGGCKVGIADVVIGAASLIARSNGVRERSSVRRKLTEMVHLTETMYACALGAAVEGTQTIAGTCMPSIALANVTKLNVTRFPFEIARLAADIAGGNMTTLPSQGDLDHPEIGPLVAKYMAAAEGIDVRERMALFRLLEHLTHGSGAVYFLHESLHGAGAPEAMRILIERELPLEEHESCARRLRAH